jgi:hypothetical protein
MGERDAPGRALGVLSRGHEILGFEPPEGVLQLAAERRQHGGGVDRAPAAQRDLRAVVHAAALRFAGIGLIGLCRIGRRSGGGVRAGLVATAW